MKHTYPREIVRQRHQVLITRLLLPSLALTFVGCIDVEAVVRFQIYPKSRTLACSAEPRFQASTSIYPSLIGFPSFRRDSQLDYMFQQFRGIFHLLERSSWQLPCGKTESVFVRTFEGEVGQACSVIAWFSLKFPQVQRLSVVLSSEDTFLQRTLLKLVMICYLASYLPLDKHEQVELKIEVGVVF